MERKLKVEFIPTAPCKRDYGTVDVVGVSHWRPDTIDTEEDYKQDFKIWDRDFQAGSKQWRDYVNHGKYLSLLSKFK